MKIISILVLFYSASAMAFDTAPFDTNQDGELSLDDLRELNEFELEALFSLGNADKMPGENLSVGEKAEFKGLPIGNPGQNALNAPLELFWGGKTFYKDEDGQVFLDNMLLPAAQTITGSTIDLVHADVSYETSVYDNKPAVLLNYQNAEIPLLNSIRDEIRLINAERDLYVGRANVFIPSKDDYLNYLRAITLVSLVNGVINNGHNCLLDNGGIFPQEGYCFGIWFALEKQ